MILLFPALVLLFLLAPAAAPAQGQSPPAEVEYADEREAARILRVARSEQARFERIRRNNLPWTWGRGGGCDPRFGDEIIGRFCLMHGEDDGKEYVPPPEAEEVVAARRALLETLYAAGSRVPWDGWLVGQRVRYLMEAGDAESAAVATRTCMAAEWWCAALAGYVHHYSGDPARADSAFERAVRIMPASEQPKWTDLSTILEGRTLREYRRLDEDGRRALEERFWALGRLLYLRPGNDLRSEHLSRYVLDIFQDRARSADGISWGEDLREILVRYGWPRGWARLRETRPHLVGGPPSLVSYYADSRVNVLPPHELLFSGRHDALADGAWDVESRRPRTAYTVPLPLADARWLRRLDHQVAAFRRPEGAVLLAAFQVAEDSVMAADSAGVAEVEAGLAVLAPGDTEPRVTRFDGGGNRGALLAVAPPGPVLLSVELLSVGARRAGRARTGYRLPALEPGVLGLSDVLLLRDGERLPDSLQAAVPLARGSDRVAPGERLGIYWEVYGLEGDEIESLSVSLRLVDRRGGWLRRTAERVGIVGESAPIRLRWQEQASAGEYHARALGIQIPEVSPGDYVLELSVARPGEEPVVAERLVEVVGDS